MFCTTFHLSSLDESDDEDLSRKRRMGEKAAAGEIEDSEVSFGFFIQFYQISK